MEDVRVGLMIRAVRRRRGLHQTDVASRIGVSRGTMSRLERGELEAASVRRLRALSHALQMPPIVSLGWRGSDIASFLDERHAALVERVIGTLSGVDWEAVPEYSFNHYGERRSVDVVGLRHAARAILLVEVKTQIVDLQDLFASLDRKRRVVPGLLAAERGWTAEAIGVVLVVPDGSALRRAIARYAASFDAALPAHSVAVRRWVQRPGGVVRGIWFLADSRGA